MSYLQSVLDSIVTSAVLMAMLALGQLPGRATSQAYSHVKTGPSLQSTEVSAAQVASSSTVQAATAIPGFLNVQAFGAVGDGRTLDTKAIAQAVRSCSDSGGCTLVFPPGRYVAGTFELLSNVTIDLEPGAVLEGSTNIGDYGYLADYGFGRTYPVNSSGEGVRMGMIIARNASNVSIVGRGTIDGRADTFMDPHLSHFAGGYNPRLTRQGHAFLKAMEDSQFGPIQPKNNGKGRPGTLMIFSHCNNVLIRGVTIRNAPNWTVHFAYCKHVVTTDVRILNSLLIPNDDGIDCIGSRDVHISNCDIRAGDDDLAIVSSMNVTVINNSLISRSSGIRLANTRYATFSNLTILSNRGVGVFHDKGDITKDILFTNLIIRTRLITGDWWGKAEPIFISVGPGQTGNDTGYIENVRFSNIIADSQAGILINGAEDSPIQGVSLQGITLNIRTPNPKIAAEVGGNFDLRGAVVRNPDDAVFKHDIPALFARYVNDLKINGFKVSWGGNLPAYFSSAIECHHFRNLQIEDFQGRQAHVQGRSPAITLSNGAVVSIRDSVASPGTGTFLAVHNVRDEGLFGGNDVKNARAAFEAGKYAFTMYGNDLPGGAGAGR